MASSDGLDVASLPERLQKHSMAGKYKYVEGDDKLGFKYLLGPGADMFLVERPHAKFYSLAITNGEVDPFPLLEEVTMDSGDVLLVTPCKTGTHWLYEIIRMLKAGNTEYTKTNKNLEWIEITTYDKICDLYPAGSRVINTHLPLSALPPKFRNSDTKVIAALRNLKDTMVSFFHHMMQMKGTYSKIGDMKDEWDTMFKFLLYSDKMPYGNYFDLYKETWDVYRTDPNILIVMYEDLKLNTQAEICKIADHLGLVCSDELISEITKAVDMSKMKAAKEETEVNFKKMFGEDKTLYRKGEIGDWKNWFTVAQNEEFHRVFDDWNKERQIPFIWE